MREVKDPVELRSRLSLARCEDRSIGLVPTMGFLHAGHLRLMEQARKENDLLVLSIFVNPTQFGAHEDLDRYPRDLDRDRQLAVEAGVDYLFAPSAAAMYPDGSEGQVIWVEPGSLAAHLCGASRPGHFRGVATVVTKLFNIVQPDRAYFGQKDAQQAIIISRMVRDLAMFVDIKIIPIVREPDGLALSSRNVYLSAEARAQATVLSRALDLARRRIQDGERNSVRLVAAMHELIAESAPLARIDYIQVADLRTLQPRHGVVDGDVLVALAVYFGSTRLIDNLVVRFEDGEARFS